jgi:hypothetical protein
VRYLGLFVLLVGVGATDVRAQACEVVLAQARERYTAGAFEAIEAFVSVCLGTGSATRADSVQGYRLQALAFLRLGALGASTAQVLKLLGVDPAYEPDPVRDPPDYVGLVRFIKEQVQGSAPEPLPPAPEAPPPVPLEPLTQRPVVSLPPPAVEPHGVPDSLLAVRGSPPRAPTPRAVSRLRIEGALGLNHYAGEGSDFGGGPYEDVFDNAGAGLQLGLSYRVRRALALGLLYEAGRYPTVPGAAEASPGDIPPPPPPPGEPLPAPVEPLSASGAWLHQASVVLRATFERWSLTPYALAGVTAAVGYLGGTLRGGVGPRVGIGVERAVRPRVAAFGEAQAALVFPALAEGPTGGGSSPLSSVRIGVRYAL